MQKYFVFTISLLVMALGISACVTRPSSSPDSSGTKTFTDTAPTSSPSASAPVGANTSPLDDKKILRQYSAEQMEATALLLRMSVNEGEKSLAHKTPSDPKEFCGINASTAQKMLTVLRPLIDEKVKMTVESYLQSPGSRKGRRGAGLTNAGWKQCTSRCTCSIYDSILSQTPKNALNKRDTAMHKWIKKEAAALNDEKSLTCAKREVWFCKSSLRTHLERATAAPASPNG